MYQNMADEADGDNRNTEKEELLENVKREAKKLMEEAVTKKFIHADSSCVTALCVAVESCISHKLKKRAGGLLAPETTESLLPKLTKYSETAAEISKQCNDTIESGSTRSTSPIPSLMSDSPQKKTSKTKNGYHVTCTANKYLWIRLALLEKVLASIISSLVEHWRDFYEVDAFIADEVLGASLVWLLDGPCSLDYSKMRTPDSIWTDPSADELVLRHRIYSSDGSAKSTLSLTKPQLFTPAKKRGDAIPGAPQVAREHVDSLHQNSHSSLLFGKNNVVLHAPEFSSPVAGYLSLHKCPESLLLKWTPNPMMDNNAETDKSQFWDRVLTVDMADVVFLHCHQTGDLGGSIVLIGQDGLQLPPMTFPSGSFCQFLSCLEQGLHPNGRLDPPLQTQQGLPLGFSKLRKQSTDKGTEEVNRVGLDDTHDYVFRLVAESSTSSLDKRELQRLLSRTSPKKFKPMWKTADERKRTLLPRMHHGRLQRNTGIPARVSLELACEKMKHQIIARAFYGWFGHSKYLKTVRTHLASLVLPLRYHKPMPDSEYGLTPEKWRQLEINGKVENFAQLMQYVYEGGIDHSLRKQVWPYLLGHYLFGTTIEERKQIDNLCKDSYSATLQECKTVELYLRDKEKDILALSGFAEGDTINSHDYEDTNDVTSELTVDTDEVDSVTKSLSDTLGSDTIGSSQELDGKDVDKNANRNQWQDLSLISSMIQKKENLREMVENASQKGREAWRNLVRKNSNRPRSKSAVEDKNSLLYLEDHEKLISFDIELSCQSCGKKIIESRERILGGSLGDTNMESVHCIGCSQARNGSHLDNGEDFDHVTMDDVDGFMNRRVVDARGDVFIPLKADTQSRQDIITVNGEDVARNSSVSTVGSQYAEDVLKDFALNIHRIDKDVLRCDRNHPYFVGHNLEKLRHVMISYVWDRLEVGYVQGMCDLCAPLLVVFDDEAKAYSCFVKLMERMEDNFPHGQAMDSHLGNMKSLIQILDPELDEILHQQGDNSIFYFCYRWFLLDFKREMLYDDVFMVWETIWAAHHMTSTNFNLFVGLALIELYRDIIIDNEMDFTDIIKFFNEMAERHDARATLNLARSIVRKLQEVMHPSDHFADNAGLD